MVPTELLVTAMVGSFAVAVTAVIAMAGVLSSRIGDVNDRFDDVRDDIRDLRGDVNARFDGMEVRFATIEGRMGGMADELVTVRASLGAIDACLTPLER